MNIPKSNSKLSQIISFYLTSPAFARLSASSQRDYEKNLMDVINTTVEGRDLGDYRIDKLKVRHITQAYELWILKGIRAANYRKSCLSAAWKNAMRYDVMTHNPVSLVQSVTSEPRRIIWKRDQVRTFFETAYGNYSWRNMGIIAHMAYDWGQRIGDMRVLTWDKLDLEGCQLDLTQSKRNAEVHLPISKGLCEMLAIQKEQFGFQPYVAPKPYPVAGKYVCYKKNEIATVINAILREANLPHELTAMDLRRTAVTEMMEGGVDLVGIMQVTGHKNIQSVKPYMVNTLSGATKALAARGNDDE